MGGADSEIRPYTQTVVLEAAAFDAATVRKTAMRLGLRTESSARFEKALDPALAATAARRFLKLLLELSAGSRVASALLDAGTFATEPPPPRVITTAGSYLRARLGLTPEAMDDAWICACLQRLGFAVEARGDQLTVTVPTWRATKDIRHAEDLVEELGRHYGYQRIPSAAPLIAARPPFTPPHKRAERQVRAALALQGRLTEVLLYGFDNEGQRGRLGLHENGLPRTGVRNTLSSEHSFLRRNLAPNLIAAVEQNLLRGDGRDAPREGLQVALFELGRVFVPVPQGPLTDAERQAIDRGVPVLANAAAADPTRTAWFRLMDAEMAGAIAKVLGGDRTLPWQPHRLGIAIGERLGGGADGNKRVAPSREVSQRVFAEAVSAVQAAAAALGKGEVRVARELVPAGGVALADADVSWRHPARGGWLIGSHGQRIGHVALLHPDVRHAFDALLAIPDAAASGAAPARHPAATVDLTVTVAASLRQATLSRHIHDTLTAAGLPLVGVRYLYEYLGAGGERSITWRLTCRAADRTLLAGELEAVLQAAQAACAILEVAPRELERA
jgi:phenylalanyl-tRNA synthetase beta subunit